MRDGARRREKVSHDGVATTHQRLCEKNLTSGASKSAITGR